MIKAIRHLWDEKPLVLILWIAILFRLIAVFFSKGFGMSDDHFSAIEIAQAWIDKSNFSHFSFTNTGSRNPMVFDFFYASFNYVILYLLKFLGITDPQVKMFIERLIHAGISMITVYTAYRITELLTNKKNARIAGLLIAIFWLMPFFSVRNMVEMVCIPFIMLGFLVLLKSFQKPSPLAPYFLAGILFGIAFLVRYQTALIMAGAGLVLLIMRKWKGTILFSLGALSIILLMHALVDWYIWGKPFAELTAYVTYNIQHRLDYIISPWYTYLLLILGILIPPVSFMFLFGFFHSWKKYLILFLPAILFLVFHSYFPNKQERFILPVLPILIILGVIGWNRFIGVSAFWKNHPGLNKGLWIYFWVINFALLIVITPMYSKKARVEAMSYLSRYKHIESILLDDPRHDNATMMPFFYLDQWPKVYQVTKEHPISSLINMNEGTGKPVPAFILFFDNKNLQERLDQIKTAYPDLVFEKEIKPGIIDNIIYRLNPINANETIYIYRNTDIFPTQMNRNAS